MGKKKSPTQKTAGNNANDLKPEVSVNGDLISVTIKFKNDKNGGHPHIIVDNLAENHVSIGLSTHAKKGKNSPNYKLTVNPLGGSKQAYMRRQGTVAPKGSYHDPKKGVMTPNDYDKAKTYGDKAKHKHIEKTHKKK